MLIAFGALLLLSKIGLGLGWLMSYLIPLALIGIGYVGIKNGSKFIGWVIFIIGLISLFSKFAGLIGFIIAGAFIVFGFTLLKKDRNAY